MTNIDHITTALQNTRISPVCGPFHTDHVVSIASHLQSVRDLVHLIFLTSRRMKELAPAILRRLPQAKLTIDCTNCKNPMPNELNALISQMTNIKHLTILGNPTLPFDAKQLDHILWPAALQVLEIPRFRLTFAGLQQLFAQAPNTQSVTVRSLSSGIKPQEYLTLRTTRSFSLEMKNPTEKKSFEDQLRRSAL